MVAIYYNEDDEPCGYMVYPVSYTHLDVYKRQATGGTLYECKAKGTFRKQKIKPLVGDIVDIAVLDEMCIRDRSIPL